MNTRSHKLAVLALLLGVLMFQGCSTLSEQVQDVVAVVKEVGDIEYHRTGVWTDSDLTVHKNEDGTRTAHYTARTKTPMGPSVSITVEDIPVDQDE